MRFKFSLLFFLFGNIILSAQISLPKIFSNHMILQRDINIPVWGKAKAGNEVVIQLGDFISTTIADESGNWMVRLSPFTAGGPYKLKVFEKKNPAVKIEFDDILIGDVWLASGQSNMEMQVQQSKDAITEIKNANYPNIRFFNVTHQKSLKPLNDIVGGSWNVCDTNSIKATSAAAYYFAREIYKNLNVPVGILQTTWGGTPVEAWTSREMLLSTSITKQKVIDNDSLTQYHFIKDSLDLIKFWDIVYNPKNKTDKTIPLLSYDDSKWQEVDMPKTMREWGIPFYEGMVWLRKSIEIPEKFEGKDLIINLGHPEMNYSLYFNGEVICKTIWNNSLTHSYTIPSNLIKKGKNTIAVRMALLWGGGGFNPPSEDMYLTNGTENIGLTGNWKYMKDLEPTIPKINNYQNYPTFLFNAMINPVIPFGIKGFIWYQGEANDTLAYQYRTLFPLLINDWRIRWQSGYLPFIYVQLPNYKSSQPEPSESEWAELREAQLLTLSQPVTGMACTIDIGDEDNIHPLNKQEVGHRLALQAEKIVYHKNIVASGPMFKSYTITGKNISVSFSEIGSGLSTLDHKTLTGFSIAGNDKKFYWATAKIKGNEVIVSSDKVLNPVAVRYAWADNPDCNLINLEGLPAIPFRTDNWRGITEK